MPAIGEVWEVTQSKARFIIAEVTPFLVLGVGFNGNRVRLPPERLDLVASMVSLPASIYVPCSVPTCGLPGWFGVDNYAFCPLHMPIGATASLTTDLRTSADPYWAPSPCIICSNPNGIPHWGPFMLASCPSCSTFWTTLRLKPNARDNYNTEKQNADCLNKVSVARVMLVHPESIPRVTNPLNLACLPSPVPPEECAIICSRNNHDHLFNAIQPGSKWVDSAGCIVTVDKAEEESVHFYGELPANNIMTRDDFVGYHRPLINPIVAGATSDPQRIPQNIHQILKPGQEWLCMADDHTVHIVDVKFALHTVIAEDALGRRHSIRLDEFQQPNRWFLVTRRNQWQHLLKDDNE